MKFSEFAGMGEKMEQLMRSVQAGRIVHALLFVGPAGTGKKSMAEVFARALLCTKDVPNRPCDECPACKRCLNATHPDLHLVEPEKNVIKVDQIRTLVDDLGLGAYEGGKKIAIIEHADQMNEFAQNALLKTLENPMGDVLFFLLTDSPSGMLPTIVSRCLTVRFGCLEPDLCAQVLIKRGMDPEHARLYASLAQGSVGRALEISEDKDYLDLRRRVIDSLEQLKRPEDVLKCTTGIRDSKGKETQILEILELLARDLMCVQNGVAPMESSDAARLQNFPYRGSDILKKVILARRELKSNLAWTNVIESLNFDLINGGA